MERSSKLCEELGKSAPGRGDSKSKSLEAGMTLV